MATDEDHQRAEASFQRAVATRNSKIAELRERSGLSMDELAKAMGYAGQSSIQRYMSPDYEMGFRPELARRFRSALIGKGEPPITDVDLQVFLGGDLFDQDDPANARHGRNLVGALASIDRKPWAAGKLKAALPVAEGEISIEMPKQLSQTSANTARVWVAHLINLAADVETAPPSDDG
jgi:transcriptional regulator with XRE-family HTH domain